MGLAELEQFATDEKVNQTRESMRTSIYTAVDTDPEQYAELQRAGQRLGMPAAILPADRMERRRLEVSRDATLDELPATHPKTAEFLSDPENSKLAWDDVQALAKVEGLFKNEGSPVNVMGIATPQDRKNAKRARSIGGAFVEGFESSPWRVGEALARSGGQKPLDILAWSLRSLGLDAGADVWQRAAQIAGESADYWKREAEARTPRKAPGSAESYFQQAGSSVGTSLAAAPFGMAGEGAALAMFGLFSEGGYNDMRQAGVSVPASAALSTSNQVMEGLTEKIGLDRLYKGSGPILKRAVQFIFGDLGGEEINTLYNSLVDKVTIKSDMTMADVMQQVIDTAIVTAIAGPMQGVTMSGAARASESLFDNYQRHQRAKEQESFLLALGDSVKASKTFARMPEKVQELISNLKQDGPIDNVFIPVERFTELFQSQGLGPEQILSDPKRYYEAQATGGDVVIPLEEFATLAKEPFYQELVRDARTNITGISAREAEAFSADTESRMNDILRMVAEEEKQPTDEPAAQTAYQRIYDDTYGQLVGIGRDPGQAEAEAAIRAKGLTTLAQRYGYDPAELERLFSVSITRGPLPAVLQRQKSFSEQQQEAELYAMLDALRSGKGAEASNMLGPSLVEFLRDKGISDDRGDLRSMDIDKGIKFKKKMLRPEGLSVDKAREAAVEAGYLPEDATVNDLLDAVANELKGQPVYSPQNVDNGAINQTRAYEELSQWLDASGIDLHQMDNTTIKEMLQKVFTQDGTTDKRGFIRFGEGIPGFEVALLKDANASTFIHEMGHYYLEVIGQLAEQENAPEGLKRDYATLLAWFGVESREQIGTEHHEQFARGFEAYLYEGKAPSPELRGVFQRFKMWLKAVYASIRNLKVELSADVRGVFDRLLATDEEIAAAGQEEAVKPIFATAEDAGMSQAEFDAYRKLAEQAHGETRDRLEQRKIKEEKRLHDAWYREQREKVQAEVEAEAEQNPVYEVLNFLYTGKLFDGSTFEGQTHKLAKAELLKHGKATVAAIQKKLGYVYSKEGGLHPEMVAERFGFSSADEMVQKMMEAPKFKEYVKAETDRRMMERFGEMNTAQIAEAAINAVHNDETARLLREELRAINRKRRELRPFLRATENEQRTARQQAADSIPPVEFFREAAKRSIAEKKVSDILPGAYSRAEAKAGKEAFELNGKGRYEEAARAKERQLLNHYLYREAVRAREDADRIAGYMRSLEKPRAQQRLGKAGQDYLDQINELLDRYEFRTVPLYHIGDRERLMEWIERKTRENGFAPEIPPSVLFDVSQVNYKTLSIGELRDVYDAAEAINYLASTAGKLYRDQQKREIAELAEEAAASIEDNSKGKKPRKPEKDLPQDRPGNMMENYFASHRKMSSLARQMDGAKDGGVMWRLIIQPLNEAGDREAVMRAEAAKNLSEVFGVYSGLERTAMHRREYIPSINTSMSKWGRITVALNMGNEGNLQRLGFMFTPEQIRAITDTLDERDWRFVQNVWDLIDGYWPEIEAKEKRVHGIAPEKVAAIPVATKYGTLAGGYYPIMYDRGETAKTGAQEEEQIYRQMIGGAFTRSTTRRGHTEARLEAVNRPLSLSIDTVFRHMNQVIHDLTHHETLIDVNRLLAAKDMQEAIRDHYGMEAYRVFTDGVRDVAIGDIPAQDAFEKFMAYTRVGVSTAALGYNLVTSLMQPLGITQSIVRIGPKWVGKGISRWIGSPRAMVETADWIYGKSDFMKTRGQTQQREIAEIRNQLTVGVIPHSVRDSFFYLIQQMQKVVDIPTWLGQYEKSMAEGADEADAIAQADQAVIDSQAGGQIKDLARIQRGGPLKKMFSTFYSFFSTTYNLAAESRAKTHFDNPAEVGRFVVDMLLLYTVPVVLTVMLKDAIQRGIGGGDDDDDKLLKKLAGEQLSYIMGGFIGLRELSSMFSGFQGYEGPAGSRFYSETAKLFKEIGQGEADAGLFKRLNSVGGILLHYPAVQVQRTVDGIIEMREGNGNLLSLLFGKPKK